MEFDINFQIVNDFLLYMRELILEKKQQGQVKTAANYRTSFLAFAAFAEHRGLGRSFPFEAMTAQLVREFEIYLHVVRGVSRNTSSCYLRPLHAVFRRGACLLGLPLPDPFVLVYTGVDKTRKRAIEADEIVALMRCKDLDKGQSFARDLFVFSFFARGIPFVDLAKLTKSNIRGGRIDYGRSKTGQVLSVKILPVMQQIIDKYSDSRRTTLFPIMGDGTFSHHRYASALRWYNDSLRLLSQAAGLDRVLTSYVARHSWASAASSLHIPMRVISESMGHTDVKTTSIYLASLGNAEVDDAAMKVFEFVYRKFFKSDVVSSCANRYEEAFPRVAVPVSFCATSTQDYGFSCGEAEMCVNS